MSNEMKRIMEAIRIIYGRDLLAATVTVMLRDGETAVRYLSITIPQTKEKNHD